MSSTNNNGNVLTQSVLDGTTATTRNQGYLYDGVNRLEVAAENGSPDPSTLTAPATCAQVTTSNWCQTYVYDARGNRALLSSSTDPSTGVSSLLVDPTTSASTVPFDVNNHWNANGITYDGGGNLTDAVASPNSLHITYDAENRQVTTTSTIGATTTATTLVYDGEGRRVSKAVGANTTMYVYDASGNLAAEYATAANPDAGTTQYLTADALGSTRLITTGTGTPGLSSRSDYLPFGQEIPTTWGGRTDYQADPSETIKFTSKERDAETGLDFFEARYYSSPQGRFTSPDEFKGGFLDAFSGKAAFQLGPLPYADLSDPQTLNKYAYVRNNPLRYVDPNGHCIEDLCIGEAIVVGAAATATANYLNSPQGQESIRATLTLAGTALDKATDAISSLFRGPSTQAQQTIGLRARPPKHRREFRVQFKLLTPLLEITHGRRAGGKNMDLPGGHDAAKDTFGQLTQGQKVVIDPKTGHESPVPAMFPICSPKFRRNSLAPPSPDELM